MTGRCAECKGELAIAENAVELAKFANGVLYAQREEPLTTDEIACCPGCYLRRRAQASRLAQFEHQDFDLAVKELQRDGRMPNPLRRRELERGAFGDQWRTLLAEWSRRKTRPDEDGSR